MSVVLRATAGYVLLRDMRKVTAAPKETLMPIQGKKRTKITKL